jgi:hypothetical protein
MGMTVYIQLSMYGSNGQKNDVVTYVDFVDFAKCLIYFKTVRDFAGFG